VLFTLIAISENPTPRPPLVGFLSQAVLGGMLPHLAFFAISKSGLAVACCLMFTMPLWTGLFAALISSAPWGGRDAANAVISLLGVLLVARPSPAADFSLIGVTMGVLFGIFGGLLNVLLGSAGLRACSPAVLSIGQMVAVVLFAVPVLYAGAMENSWSPSAVLLGGTSMSMTILVSLLTAGSLLWTSMCVRTIGLQRAASSTVATLLYTEIVWSFFFDVVINSMHPDVLQLGGATLIIGGAIVYAFAPKPEPRPERGDCAAVPMTAPEEELK